MSDEWTPERIHDELERMRILTPLTEGNPLARSKTMKKTRAELETIIRRAADEQDWEVFSEDQRVIRKLTKLFGEGKKDHQSSSGVRWLLGSGSLSFRKPRKVSEAQREILRARFARNIGAAGDE